MKATFVKDLDNFSGKAALYELDEEVGYNKDWDEEGKFNGHTKHVVVSATVTMFSGPETYIFASDENGKILDWIELHGSYRGGMDLQTAIDGMCA
jgi:hypothetical protein